VTAPASSAPATVTSGAPEIPRPRTPRAFTVRQKIIISVLNVAAFFALWELATQFTNIPSLFLPALTDVFAEYGAMHREGILLNNLWISVRTYLIGMAVSLVFAIPGGLLIGGVKVLDRVLSPYIWTLYTLPRIILMPLVLLWVGINRTATLVLIVLSAVPATIVFVMDGVKTADASLLRAARSFGADRRRLFTYVVMPSTLPFIATGVRMGVARGLLGLYIGEIFTGATGIGYILTLAFKTFDTARMFAMLLLFVLFSIFMVGLTQVLERKASLWKATDV
jgi:ABC-type nitrate/sulfonate/bicarbonate transport system permease component